MSELAEPDALSSVNKAATWEGLDGSAQAAVKKDLGSARCRHATGAGMGKMGTNWEQAGNKLGRSWEQTGNKAPHQCFGILPPVCWNLGH